MGWVGGGEGVGGGGGGARCLVSYKYAEQNGARVNFTVS